MRQDKIIYKIEYYFLQIKRRSNSSEGTIKVWDKYGSSPQVVLDHLR